MLKIDYFWKNLNKGDSGNFSVNPRIHPEYEFRNFTFKKNRIQGEFLDSQKNPPESP